MSTDRSGSLRTGIPDDLADLLDRSRRVTVQNGVPSARASGLDMYVYELFEAKTSLLFTARAIGRVAQNGRGTCRTQAGCEVPHLAVKLAAVGVPHLCHHLLRLIVVEAFRSTRHCLYPPLWCPLTFLVRTLNYEPTVQRLKVGTPVSCQEGTFSSLVRKLRSPDTVNEVTIMVEAKSTEDHEEAGSAARFRKLPERIRPEDMIATQETEPPPDPTMGRDTERDFMLRNAGS